MADRDLGNAVRIDLYQEICNTNFCGVCYAALLKNRKRICRLCQSEIENCEWREGKDGPSAEDLDIPPTADTPEETES
ncbi:hypothetical protein TWF730_004467 [Orbilia blumenaviensis]|uniref:Uncharacterized protein n=1 Tax=Orbilia blumenaviensis TaxID=1796055 RepID=A0AAV9TYJ8_9PEZI